MAVQIVIDALEGCSIKERKARLDELRSSLTDDPDEVESLDEGTKTRVFEALFEILNHDQKLYDHAKTSASKKTIANRLSEAADTLRSTTEALYLHIKGKNVKSLIGHLTETDLTCDPTALNYARTLATVLSYGVHVEHFMPQAWLELCSYVIKNLRLAMGDSDFGSFTGRSSNGTQGSQKQLIDEMLRCMFFITNVPNANISESAPEILHVVTTLLAEVQLLPLARQNAFASINNVFNYIMTENIELSKTMTHRLIQLVNQHWYAKDRSLNDELLVTLTYLRPYIEQKRRTLKDEVFEADITDVVNTLLSEYTRRSARERLGLTDLHLHVRSDQPSPTAARCFSLRTDTADRDWALLEVLAVLIAAETEVIRETQVDEGEQRKRPRLDTDGHDLESRIISGSSTERVVILQVLSLIAQRRSLEPALYERYANMLISLCNEDDAEICNWAYLALASLAWQPNSSSAQMKSTWQTNSSPPQMKSIWQTNSPSAQMKSTWQTAWHTASRAITSSTASRAASHLLDVMLQLQLVEQSTVSQFAQSLIASMELNGPASFCDSSLHLCTTTLSMVKVELPAASGELATQVINWLFRKWSPSQTWTSNAAFFAEDIIGLISQVCDQDYIISPLYMRSASRVRKALHHTTACEPLLNFLLLVETPDKTLRTITISPCTHQATTPHKSAALLLTGNLQQELTKLLDDLPTSVSAETFSGLAKTTYVATYTMCDLLTDKNLEDLCGKLLTAILRMATHSEGPTLLNILLTTLDSAKHGKVGRYLADTVSLSFHKRCQYPWSTADVSQRTTDQNTQMDAELGMRAAYSAAALRAVLYTDDGDPMRPMSVTAEYITDLTGIDLLLALKAFTTMDADLYETDLEQILDLCTQSFFSTYTFNRSELALSTIIDFMSFTHSVWTDEPPDSLKDLVADMYDWLTNVALTANVLSPNTKTRLSALLMQLCETKPDYGTDRSARTSLFQMLKDGPIRLQFFLAPKLPAMFRLLSLSLHHKLFDDLQQSLPVDMTWTEGIAIRLLIFAELGSTWSSLLAVCTYYIFETGGSVASCKPYASKCVRRISSTLQISKSSELFRMFSPQLLFTWLDSHSLLDIPYTIFDYTRAEFLTENAGEITAQLFLRRMDLAPLLESESEPVKVAFDRVYAYALGQDIAEQSSSCEQRLKATFVGKEDMRKAINSTYPVIVGRLFLSLDIAGTDGEWLRAREGYDADAYEQMTSCSSSAIQTTPLRQPYFSSRQLPDQLDRLQRRLSTPLWTPSVYSIVSQMIFDSLDSRQSALQNLATIQALRLLLSVAGQTVLDGSSLRTTITSLVPFLGDSHCADDVIGMLYYLLSVNEQYLTEHIQFAWGKITIIILHIKQQLAARQDDMTQERETVGRLKKFGDWLYGQLERLRTALPVELQTPSNMFVNHLASLDLPCTPDRDAPGGGFLLDVLEGNLCSETDSTEILAILSTDFQLVEDDCIATDADAVHYANNIRKMLSRKCSNKAFLQWCAIVLGRAYAASGPLPILPADETTSSSLERVAKSVLTLYNSSDRRHISLGTYTYRSCIEQCKNPSDAREFEKAFPEPMFNDGTYGYVPSFVNASVKASSIDDLLARSATDLIEWTAPVFQALCGLSAKTTIIRGLTIMLQYQPEIGVDLFPALLHLVLRDNEFGGREAFRLQMVNNMSAAFARNDLILSKLFLQTLLYMLEQPWLAEATLMERLKWLPCDYVVAASCAAKLGMVTAALKLVELSQSSEPWRRTSRPRVTPPAIPDTILLHIFSNLDDPDSYYAIERPPTLDTYLDRTIRQQDGYNTLIAMSAQADAEMTQLHALPDHTTQLFSESLSRSSLNSLSFAVNSLFAAGEQSDPILNKARLLEQWDIPLPRSTNSPSSVLYRASSALAAGTDTRPALLSQVGAVVDHTSDVTKLSDDWLQTVSILVEMLDLTSSQDLKSTWESMINRLHWMRSAPAASFMPIIETRCTTLSSLATRASVFSNTSLLISAKALASLAALSQEQDRSESAMSAVWRLSDLAKHAKAKGLQVSNLARHQLASTMWHVGETATSVKILEGILTDNERDDCPIAESTILAQIGQQLADARLQDPASILNDYLKPAIDKLESSEGEEACQAFHTFAAFCDAQLSNAAALEDYDRIVRLRQTKLDEVTHLKSLIRGMKGEAKERHERTLRKTNQWLQLDEAEFRRLTDSRDVFTQQSLKNYMRALSAADKYNSCVLRLYALWLENADSTHAQDVVEQFLSNVPSWKFVVLMNQLMSRLSTDESTFQSSLLKLVHRVCQDHVYHTVHHVYAYRKSPGRGEAAEARRAAAEAMCKELANHKQTGSLFTRMLKADSLYRLLAEEQLDASKGSNKHTLKDSICASKLARYIPGERVSPATLDLPLEPDAKYTDVPVITSILNSITIMNGLSAPKALTAVASNGQKYKQLFKGGNDDLRQDAIMEQVFSEVSKMLRKHKATRQRQLQVRTYKVIPLSARSGIIEFVPNSIPINDFLQPAHLLYYHGSMKSSAARQRINNVADHSTDTRVKEFQKVCEQIPPVLRFFFLERFQDPDAWFAKRTAYARTTATISMLGHVLGLGDRHCHNILLDQKSGEVIHIDLGVAFETGRVLPIPELVPFRLTRDIVDGMGITGVEGVFRRCCEFTMEALRQEKSDIMTLLNVLRYDPLYSWTLSPLRAKRIQQQEDQDTKTSDVVPRKQVDEAGEAERALSVVEKKLGSSLSAAAAVSELIQQARDDRNLATLFNGWAAFF